MTTPLGLSHDENHVYTANYPDEPVVKYTSITTALKALDKPAIPIWARQMTARAAVENMATLATMIETGGAEATIEYLVRIADHKRDTKADSGSRTHALIDEFYTSGRQMPQVVEDDVLPYWRAFLDFDAAWRPEVIATEYMVCHPEAGYAGTGDLVVLVRCPVDFNGYCRFRLDTKTMGVYTKGPKVGQRKGPYRETALQLAAAHYATFAGRPNDPKKYTVPRADHCGVLALAEDGSHALVPYTVTQDTFEAFKSTLAVWRWLNGEAKTAIGQVLAATVEAIAA